MGRRESRRLSEWRRGSNRSLCTGSVRERRSIEILLERFLGEGSKAWRDSELIEAGNEAGESARRGWLDSSARIRIRRRLRYPLQQEAFQKQISVHYVEIGIQPYSRGFDAVPLLI